MIYEFVSRPFHRGKEAIADLGQSLDEFRSLSRVFKCLPQFPHRSVETVLEIDKGIFRPQGGTHLLAAHHLSVGNQKKAKHLKGLTLDRTLSPDLWSLPLAQIDVESVKSGALCR